MIFYYHNINLLTIYDSEYYHDSDHLTFVILIKIQRNMEGSCTVWVRKFLISSTSGSNISSSSPGLPLTLYLILSLFGGSDTVTMCTILKRRHTAQRVDLVAVAVKAIILTLSGMRLRTSPSHFGAENHITHGSYAIARKCMSSHHICVHTYHLVTQ